MHQLTIVSLAVAYALLGCLLLALCVRGRWSAWLKIPCIVLCSGFYIWHYNSLQESLGWPTEQILPHKFVLIAQQVVEPNPNTGDPGSIYLWATTIQADEVDDIPRSYHLPYNKNLHSQLDLARNGQRKGIPQIGELSETDSRFFATRLTVSQVDNIKIFDLPEPTLPDK